MEDRFKYAELIRQESFVAARAIIPIAPINAALIPAKYPRASQPMAESCEHVVGFALHSTAIKRHHKMTRLGMGAAAILIVPQGIAKNDV